MSNYEESKELANLLFLKYGSLTLNTIQTAEATNRSKISLERDRRNASGIPYTKLGANAGSDKALYSVMDIAKYVVSKKVKTA